jgi:hypothetical protein
MYVCESEIISNLTFLSNAKMEMSIFLYSPILINTLIYSVNKLPFSLKKMFLIGDKLHMRCCFH